MDYNLKNKLTNLDMARHATAPPVLRGTEAEGLLGLAGCQFGSRLSERACLMGIKQRVIKQNTQHLPLPSKSTWAYTSAHTHTCTLCIIHTFTHAHNCNKHTSFKKRKICELKHFRMVSTFDYPSEKHCVKDLSLSREMTQPRKCFCTSMRA